jgi:hypothetical protein
MEEVTAHTMTAVAIPVGMVAMVEAPITALLLFLARQQKVAHQI